MNLLAQAWAVARKDFLVERRRKEALNTMIFFAALVLFIFSFALGPDRQQLQAASGGLIWLALTFTSVLGLGRAFQIELENNCLEGLLLYPVEREAIYLGKLASNLGFLLLLEVVLFPLVAVLYDLDLWNVLPALLGVAVLGTVGFATVGTFYAALTVNLRAREAMLPLLLFPVVAPVILGAVKATGLILQGGATDQVLGWVRLLAVFDVIYLVICPLIFEYVVEE